jgi:hypothetical protein
MLLLAIHCSAVSVMGQMPASGEKRTDVAKPSKKASVARDYRKLVEGLAGPN